MVSVGGFSSGKLGDIFGNMSDDEWNQFLSNQQKSQSRQAQLNSLRGGNQNTSNSGLFGGVSGNTSSNNASSLFGGLGDLTKSDGYKSLVDQAKDMAQFRLGLDKDQAQFSYGLRDKEAEGNFGRQFKLDTQQRQFDRDINTDTQSALTQRLDKELNNRLQQQQTGINQENFATNRAIRLASRRLGG